jgi:hypothetical protein
LHGEGVGHEQGARRCDHAVLRIQLQGSIAVGNELAMRVSFREPKTNSLRIVSPVAADGLVWPGRWRWPVDSWV